MSRKQRQYRQAIHAFTMLNFVLCGLCLASVLFFSCGLFRRPRTDWLGISGDSGLEYYLGLTGLLYTIVYEIAGLELLWRWKISYTYILLER
jgi:hypothetical protein